MTSRFLSRRSLLKTLSIGAGTAPLLKSLGRDFLPNAHAADGGGPRRILFAYVANGVPPHNAGFDEFCKAGDSPTTFKLGPLTTPFEALRDDLVVLDNLEMIDAIDVNTHVVGMKQLLTGLFPTDEVAVKDRSRHISIDQYLGQKLGRLVTPKWPALPPMAVRTDGTSNSHLEDGTMIKANEDPYDLYKKIFDGLVTGTSAPTPDPLLLARIARRKSVLDSVSKDLVSFQKRLGAEDRMRAEAQATSIRSMEDRLAGAMSSSAGAGAGCSKPTQKPGLNHKDPKTTPDMFRMELDLIVNAFACDVSRVATLSFSAEDYHVYNCDFDPVNYPQSSWHGLSHDDPKDDFATYIKAKQWAFAQIADVAARMKQIPDAGGGSMLDNTIIFVGTEIGRGHTNAGLQFVTLGGKNLGVNTGRYLFFGKARQPNQGISHTRLLVSFLKAMGLPDDVFGDTAKTGTGPLQGYLR